MTSLITRLHAQLTVLEGPSFESLRSLAYSLWTDEAVVAINVP